MDRLHAYKRRIQVIAFVVIVIFGVIMVAATHVVRQVAPDHTILVYAGLAIFGLIQAFFLAKTFGTYATEPLEFIWRAVMHVSPNGSSIAAPNLDRSRVAHELVNSVVLQVYQLASSSQELPSGQAPPKLELMRTINNQFPLPVFAIDKNRTIIFANEAALKYLGQDQGDVLHKNFYSALDLAFSDKNTIDAWVQDCRANKATDVNWWRRVRLKLADQTTLKQFDMAAAYNKENPAGAEIIVTLFDQTLRYQSDDQALDFIALAVHELRTPLTALHGYIEVFEEEFEGKLNPEMTDFMHKMRASAQQLTVFVNNILKVGRLEQGQVSLQLYEENWESIVKEAVQNLRLQAEVRGISLDYTITPNLPTVAVDKISITEVINNLVENAIKYSGKGKKITITSTPTRDGLVETVVRDDGVGIPSSVMPHLFEKFHRNHRNQSKIGGTGLGLYLCSALIQAHGGNIWVKSKEGEGAAIGFTVQDYSKLADGLKDSHNTGITRNAHGWIKNHSLYRR